MNCGLWRLAAGAGIGPTRLENHGEPGWQVSRRPKRSDISDGFASNDRQISTETSYDQTDWSSLPPGLVYYTVGNEKKIGAGDERPYSIQVLPPAGSGIVPLKL